MQARVDSGGSGYARLLGARVRVLPDHHQRPVGFPQGRRDPDPAAHALADGCPAQVDSPRLQASPDQVRGMVGQRRDQEMGTDPLVQLVEHRPKPELRFERPESGFDFGEPPI